METKKLKNYTDLKGRSKIAPRIASMIKTALTCPDFVDFTLATAPAYGDPTEERVGALRFIAWADRDGKQRITEIFEWECDATTAEAVVNANR